MKWEVLLVTKIEDLRSIVNPEQLTASFADLLILSLKASDSRVGYHVSKSRGG